MFYLIDAIIVTREVFILSFVVLSSLMGLIAGALSIGSTE
jgi:hypothetical protein